MEDPQALDLSKPKPFVNEDPAVFVIRESLLHQVQNNDGSISVIQETTTGCEEYLTLKPIGVLSEQSEVDRVSSRLDADTKLIKIKNGPLNLMDDAPTDYDATVFATGGGDYNKCAVSKKDHPIGADGENLTASATPISERSPHTTQKYCGLSLLDLAAAAAQVEPYADTVTSGTGTRDHRPSTEGGTSSLDTQCNTLDTKTGENEISAATSASETIDLFMDHGYSTRQIPNLEGNNPSINGICVSKTLRVSQSKVYSSVTNQSSQDCSVQYRLSSSPVVKSKDTIPTVVKSMQDGESDSDDDIVITGEVKGNQTPSQITPSMLQQAEEMCSGSALALAFKNLNYTYICRACRTSYENEHLIKRHINEKHWHSYKEGPYVCKECLTMSASCKQFKRHVKHVHKTLHPVKLIPNKILQMIYSRLIILPALLSQDSGCPQPIQSNQPTQALGEASQSLQQQQPLDSYGEVTQPSPLTMRRISSASSQGQQSATPCEIADYSKYKAFDQHGRRLSFPPGTPSTFTGENSTPTSSVPSTPNMLSVPSTPNRPSVPSTPNFPSVPSTPNLLSPPIMHPAPPTTPRQNEQPNVQTTTPDSITHGADLNKHQGTGNMPNTSEHSSFQIPQYPSMSHITGPLFNGQPENANANGSQKAEPKWGRPRSHSGPNPQMERKSPFTTSPMISRESKSQPGIEDDVVVNQSVGSTLQPMATEPRSTIPTQQGGQQHMFQPPSQIPKQQISPVIETHRDSLQLPYQMAKGSTDQNQINPPPSLGLSALVSSAPACVSQHGFANQTVSSRNETLPPPAIAMQFPPLLHQGYSSANLNDQQGQQKVPPTNCNNNMVSSKENNTLTTPLAGTQILPISTVSAQQIAFTNSQTSQLGFPGNIANNNIVQISQSYVKHPQTGTMPVSSNPIQQGHVHPFGFHRMPFGGYVPGGIIAQRQGYPYTPMIRGLRSPLSYQLPYPASASPMTAPMRHGDGNGNASIIKSLLATPPANSMMLTNKPGNMYADGSNTRRRRRKRLVHADSQLKNAVENGHEMMQMTRKAPSLEPHIPYQDPHVRLGAQAIISEHGHLNNQTANQSSTETTHQMPINGQNKSAQPTPSMHCTIASSNVKQDVDEVRKETILHIPSPPQPPLSYGPGIPYAEGLQDKGLREVYDIILRDSIKVDDSKYVAISLEQNTSHTGVETATSISHREKTLQIDNDNESSKHSDVVIIEGENPTLEPRAGGKGFQKCFEEYCKGSEVNDHEDLGSATRKVPKMPVASDVPCAAVEIRPVVQDNEKEEETLQDDHPKKNGKKHQKSHTLNGTSTGVKRRRSKHTPQEGNIQSGRGRGKTARRGRKPGLKAMGNEKQSTCQQEEITEYKAHSVSETRTIIKRQPSVAGTIHATTTLNENNGNGSKVHYGKKNDGNDALIPQLTSQRRKRGSTDSNTSYIPETEPISDNEHDSGCEVDRQTSTENDQRVPTTPLNSPESVPVQNTGNALLKSHLSNTEASLETHNIFREEKTGSPLPDILNEEEDIITAARNAEVTYTEVTNALTESLPVTSEKGLEDMASAVIERNRSIPDQITEILQLDASEIDGHKDILGNTEDQLVVVEVYTTEPGTENDFGGLSINNTDISLAETTIDGTTIESSNIEFVELPIVNENVELVYVNENPSTGCDLEVQTAGLENNQQKINEEHTASAEDDPLQSNSMSLTSKTLDCEPSLDENVSVSMETTEENNMTDLHAESIKLSPEPSTQKWVLPEAEKDKDHDSDNHHDSKTELCSDEEMEVEKSPPHDSPRNQKDEETKAPALPSSIEIKEMKMETSEPYRTPTSQENEEIGALSPSSSSESLPDLCDFDSRAYEFLCSADSPGEDDDVNKIARRVFQACPSHMQEKVIRSISKEKYMPVFSSDDETEESVTSNEGQTKQEETEQGCNKESISRRTQKFKKGIRRPSPALSDTALAKVLAHVRKRKQQRGAASDSDEPASKAMKKACVSLKEVISLSGEATYFLNQWKKPRRAETEKARRDSSEQEASKEDNVSYEEPFQNCDRQPKLQETQPTITEPAPNVTPGKEDTRALHIVTDDMIKTTQSLDSIADHLSMLFQTSKVCQTSDMQDEEVSTTNMVDDIEINKESTNIFSDATLSKSGEITSIVGEKAETLTDSQENSAKCTADAENNNEGNSNGKLVPYEESSIHTCRQSACEKEMWKCFLCCLETDSLEAIKLHCISHIKLKPYQCCSCRFKARTEVAAADHINGKHSPKDKFKLNKRDHTLQKKLMERLYCESGNDFASVLETFEKDLKPKCMKFIKTDSKQVDQISTCQEENNIGLSMPSTTSIGEKASSNKKHSSWEALQSIISETSLKCQIPDAGDTKCNSTKMDFNAKISEMGQKGIFSKLTKLLQPAKDKPLNGLPPQENEANENEKHTKVIGSLSQAEEMRDAKVEALCSAVHEEKVFVSGVESISEKVNQDSLKEDSVTLPMTNLSEKCLSQNLPSIAKVFSLATGTDSVPDIRLSPVDKNKSTDISNMKLTSDSQMDCENNKHQPMEVSSQNSKSLPKQKRRKRRLYKIDKAQKAIQPSLKVNRPTYGSLFQRSIFQGKADSPFKVTPKCNHMKQLNNKRFCNKTSDMTSTISKDEKTDFTLELQQYIKDLIKNDPKLSMKPIVCLRQEHIA